ncbi:MAG: L,D-transpeptidase, partial [Clostridia bacterium]|nr:L,D-transpeptidase [Clostridia bacterium]
MKKALKIIIPTVSALLVAGGGAGYYVQTQVDTAQLQQAQTYTQYQDLGERAADCTFTVTENGEEIGTYTLEDLGGLADAQREAASQDQDGDTMRGTEFSALPLQTQLAYKDAPHPKAETVKVPLANFSSACIMQDLQAVERTPAQDANVTFENSTYTLHPEVPGNELREDVILGAINACAEDLQFSTTESSHVSLEITDYDCYRQPQITVENGDFDFQKMLDKKLDQIQIVVAFPEGHEELDAEQIHQLIYLDNNNTVRIHEEQIPEYVKAWGEKHNQHDVAFQFDSYLKGVIPIEKERVNYILDEPALCDSILSQLEKLESSSLPAPILCQTLDGEPLDIADDHVEIDIDNQKLTLIRNGEVVISTDVVTGALVFVERKTITGLYHAYCKETNVTMTNITAANPNPDDPYSVFSQYFIGIEGEYGI